MAGANKGVMVLSLGALVVVVLVMMSMAQPAETSTFVFYSGACTGNSATLNSCACSNIPANTKGGYSFEYTGQTAHAYNCANCNCAGHTGFTASTGQCSALGWQSILINC